MLCQSDRFIAISRFHVVALCELFDVIQAILLVCLHGCSWDSFKFLEHGSSDHQCFLALTEPVGVKGDVLR